MKNTIIKIQPVIIQVEDLKIYVEYRLNDKAIINYALTTTNGIQVESGFVTLTDEEFANWGTDDTYVENLILDKLKLKKA